MSFALPAFAVIAGAIRQRQEEAEARRQAQAQILQSSASALGAPTYNVQAAQVLRNLDNQPSPAGPLLQHYLQSRMKQPGGR